MSKARFSAAALAFASAALLSSCNGSGTSGAVLPAAGNYAGFYNNQEVTAVLKQVSDHEIQLTLSNPSDTSWSESWDVLWDSANQLTLTLPSGKQVYKPSPDSNASTSASDFSMSQGQDSYELSWAVDELHWDELGPGNATLGDLDLTQIGPNPIPSLEPPQTYGLDQLIDHAKTHGFASVVEFQKVLLAKDNAVNADMDLLPHGNTQDVLNLMSMSLFTALKSVGDLVPFLLPSRWFRAAEQNDELASEKEAWAIIDLDGVNYVESFAYEAARDGEALQAIALERSHITGVRDLVQEQEKAGQVQIGTSGALTSLVNTIDQNSNNLSVAQASEATALAQAAGFYNPQAVSGVTLPQDPGAPSVGNPLSVNFTTSSQLAVQRSLELLQLQDLLAWAKNEKNARYWDWLDPSGNQTGGVGLGLPSYIEAGQDQLDEIVAEQQEKTASLLSNVQDTIDQLQKNVDDYNMAVSDSQTEDQRVQRQLVNLQVGNSFDMNELVSAYQAQVNSQLSQIDAEYGYLLALSRFNRLLYQGVYSSVTAGKAGATVWSDSP